MSVRIIGTSQSSEANVFNPPGETTSRSLCISPYDSTGISQGSGWTFDVATTAFTPGATPQDVVTITNTGAKTIYVTRFRFATVQTTAGINSWYLVRRNTPNYAGTFTYQTPVPRQPFGPQSSTAMVQVYTANPTVAGVSLGFIRSAKVFSSAAATPGSSSLDQWIWDFDDFQSNPIALRGFGQVLGLNFNGVALPTALSVQASITWTEE